MLENYIEKPENLLEKLKDCKTEFEALTEKYTESKTKIRDKFYNTLKEFLFNKWIRFEEYVSNGVSIKGYYLVSNVEISLYNFVDSPITIKSKRMISIVGDFDNPSSMKFEKSSVEVSHTIKDYTKISFITNNDIIYQLTDFLYDN